MGHSTFLSPTNFLIEKLTSPPLSPLSFFSLQVLWLDADLWSYPPDLIQQLQVSLAPSLPPSVPPSLCPSLPLSLPLSLPPSLCPSLPLSF